MTEMLSALVKLLFSKSCKLSIPISAKNEIPEAGKVSAGMPAGTTNGEMDAIDAEVRQMIHQQEASNADMQVRTRVLLQHIEHSLLLCGMTDAFNALSSDVEEILQLTLSKSRGIDKNKTDVMKAMRLLMYAAWRVAFAAVRGVERTTDPTNKEGPDDPIVI